MAYFLSIFFGTFVLEDLALVSGLGLALEQKLSWELAFLACFLGISIGDLALYELGALAKRFASNLRGGRWHSWLLRLERSKDSTSLGYAVFFTRFVPGTRLLTYTLAGFAGYSRARFLVITLVSVFIWVLAAFLLGGSLQVLFGGRLLLILPAILLLLVGGRFLLAKLRDPWHRRALVHSWRKWQSFEFWPAWLFYLPIVPYYAYLSLRGGSLLLPFYANPGVLNGGLIGESKWDFLQHLSADDPGTLPTAPIVAGLSLEERERRFQNFSYPFILKPDIGQRGYGVRVIRNQAERDAYLLGNEGKTLLAQTKSQYQREAGVFYYRHPGEETGHIFSITDKLFPFLTGNGLDALGTLILKDPRARIIAAVYFSRHSARLSEVIPAGEQFLLSECGNHCQGAIFKNGAALITPELSARIDEIAKQIPDFYFGRVDLRYRDQESFRRGEHFEVIEVNGAGAEATHIWDPTTTLPEAYRTLFEQWKILFTIGGEVKKLRSQKPRIRVLGLLAECFSVFRRSDAFSVSS